MSVYRRWLVRDTISVCYHSGKLIREMLDDFRGIYLHIFRATPTHKQSEPVYEGNEYISRE